MSPTKVTRRGMLGAGLLAAAGGGAVALGQDRRGRRWLHAAGVLHGPDADVPRSPAPAVVRSGVLQSAHRPREVRYAVAAPAPAAGSVGALVACLHGRGGDERFPFATMGVHRFVAARRLPWAVVGIDGGEAYWHRRRDGRAPDAALFDELLPMLAARLGGDGVPVLLLGWSMGGFGALLAAADRGDAVTAVAASSAALWRSPRDTAPGAFDGAADFRAHDVFARVDDLRAMGGRVRIDCGDDDPFLGANRALVSVLPEASVSFGAGFHDAATWRSRLPAQLDFFRQVLASR